MSLQISTLQTEITTSDVSVVLFLFTRSFSLRATKRSRRVSDVLGLLSLLNDSSVSSDPPGARLADVKRFRRGQQKAHSCVLIHRRHTTPVSSAGAPRLLKPDRRSSFLLLHLQEKTSERFSSSQLLFFFFFFTGWCRGSTGPDAGFMDGYIKSSPFDLHQRYRTGFFFSSTHPARFI